jgi:hypothetical protein
MQKEIFGERKLLRPQPEPEDEVRDVSSFETSGKVFACYPKKKAAQKLGGILSKRCIRPG